MYMIAGLCMLKLYQKRHPDINASAYTAYACLAVVIFFSVLGVVSTRRDTLLMLHQMHTAHVFVGVFAGIWERQPGVLDCFLCDPHFGHSPPQHTALLHGPVEVW